MRPGLRSDQESGTSGFLIGVRVRFSLCGVVRRENSVIASNTDRAASRLHYFRGALLYDKLTVGAGTMDLLGDILETMAHTPIKKRAIANHGVLSEAFEYAKPSSFSRGMRIDLNGLSSCSSPARPRSMSVVRASTSVTFAPNFGARSAI